MNLQKMKKQSARNTPDSVSRMFDIFDEHYRMKYESWLEQFQRHMSIKHGKALRGIHVWSQDQLNDRNKLQITLEAKVNK